MVFVIVKMAAIQDILPLDALKSIYNEMGQNCNETYFYKEHIPYKQVCSLFSLYNLSLRYMYDDAFVVVSSLPALVQVLLKF